MLALSNIYFGIIYEAQSGISNRRSNSDLILENSTLDYKPLTWGWWWQGTVKAEFPTL